MASRYELTFVAKVTVSVTADDENEAKEAIVALRSRLADEELEPMDRTYLNIELEKEPIKIEEV